MLHSAEKIAAIATTQRYVEGVIESDRCQIDNLRNIVHRVESLLERLRGAQPQEAGCVAASPQRPNSVCASLEELHFDRERLVSRLSEAMDIIEGTV